MFVLVNLIVFVLIVSFCSSFIKKKLLKYVLSIGAALFVNLQMLSIYISGSFVDYKFYTHSNFDDILIFASLFKWHIILSFFIILLFVYLFFFLEKKLQLLTVRMRLISGAILLIGGASLMSFKGGIIDESYRLFSILNTSDNTALFEESLQKLNIHNYVQPDKTTSTKGKNIIVISLESFEKGFLNDKFSHLTPNLRALQKEWSYFDMSQNSGSEWTSGSLYTSLTGFPAFFNTLSNQTFQNSYGTKINSVSNVLKKSNYETTYLIGNSDFSGTEDMLTTYGFDKVIDYKDLNGKYDVFDVNDLSDNNIHDKDLFEEAKEIVQQYQGSEDRYALFISTISTHFPDGIFDKRMQQHITEKASKLEFMVAAVDYMIGDFVQFLKNEKLLENTIVYIFPDHLKMGSDAIFEGTGERGLFVISNANKEDIGFANNEEILQIDLPKILLNGSNVKNNAKFLTDYIEGDKNKFISTHLNDITSVNVTGLQKVNNSRYSTENISNVLKYKYKKTFDVETKHYQKYVKDTLRFIAHAGGMVDGQTYTNSLEALNENYGKGFRLFELDILKTKDGKYVSIHDWEKWKILTGFTGDTPVSEKEFIEHSKKGGYTLLTMDDINAWFLEHTDAVLVTDKINEPYGFSKEFIDKDRLMMELFSLEKVIEGIDAGIASAIVSESVIKKLKKNRFGTLVNLGIKDIAVSYRYIAKNVTFLKKLKAAGVNTYVYHVNYDEGVDEDYIVKYEMDYIYGMYADKWNFK